MSKIIKNLSICAATLAASAMVTSCGGDQQTQGQQQAPAPTIATMTVSTADSELNTSYPATVKGRTDIEIRPQVTGFITKVHVDEGQHVSKGQVLFTLDQVQFQAAVESAQAAVNQANTAVSTAQLTYNNKKHLYDKNIISEYELQMAENSLNQAKAALAQAQSSLVTAKKNLSYTVVTAPSSGVVGSIPNREGSLASPSSMTPLTTVSDNSQVYAYFSLNEKDLLDLTQNGTRSLNAGVAEMPKVSLMLANGELYPLKGTVATVSGVIDQSTGGATVRALFDNPSGMIHSGSSGNILIPHISEDVIIIPQKATFELQDKKFVYVVGDSNKVVSTPITISEHNDGKNYIVTSGLTPGQVIAIEGVGTTVKDGVVITPVDAAQAAQKVQDAPAAQK